MASAKPLSAQLVDSLRSQIISGALPPETWLREEELARSEGVSRLPVREALQRLAHEGYVDLIPRRGARVAQVSVRRTLEIMEVRRALEVLAARKAAKVKGGAAADDLRRTLDAGLDAIASGQLDELHDLVDRFHHLIAVASGSQEILLQLESYRSRVRWVFEVDVAHRAEGSWVDHQEILEAVLAGNTRRAATLMDVHVAKDEQVWRELAEAKADPATPA
jgi:DNA-binding GntR family transcriptional regulator